jgi:hypothetical protein
MDGQIEKSNDSELFHMAGALVFRSLFASAFLIEQS